LKKERPWKTVNEKGGALSLRVLEVEDPRKRQRGDVASLGKGRDEKGKRVRDKLHRGIDLKSRLLGDRGKERNGQCLHGNGKIGEICKGRGRQLKDRGCSSTAGSTYPYRRRKRGP